MDKFYNETLRSLETTITEMEIEVDSPSQRIATVIYLILESLSDVKEYVLKRGFKNIDQEIRFFKHQKPTIVAKLIYYNVGEAGTAVLYPSFCGRVCHRFSFVRRMGL